MPKLSVIDLAMFLLETKERPFNIGPLVVLSPPKGSRGNFADKLTARMLRRPAGAPFTYRLRTPAIGLPSLAEDDELDLASHVHRRTLDAPGSMEQLFALISGIHQVHLERGRPLWDAYVIDGLEGGKVAVYGKVHHGIIDGRTFMKVMSHWLALTPNERTVRAFWEGVPREPRESRARASLSDIVGDALRTARGATGSALGLSRLLAKQALSTVGVGNGLALPMLGVPKAFHGKAAAERSFAFCTVPLAEVKAVAKSNVATVNDVLLAALDAGMARHLHERGKLPRRPLVADMPLALQDARGGNQIAVLQFPLGAPGMGAIERLAAIGAEAGRVKNVIKQESADTMMLFTTVVHGLPAAAERLGIKRGMQVSNVLVSNPFGMQEERYLMGAHVELALPMSVVAAGHMLNVTAVTLADNLQIGFLAMPNAVPHVEKLAAYTREAFDDLKHATLESTPGRAARPSKKRAPPALAKSKVKTRPAPRSRARKRPA